MKIRWVLTIAITAAGVGGLAGFGLADEEGGGGEMDEVMAMILKLHEPGPHQAVLEPMVGEWNAVTTMYSEPGKEPQTGEGTARNEWTAGGRILRVSFDGDFFGEPFHGEGHMGHDNHMKEYQSTWIDSMSTNIYTSTGSWDAEKKQLTMKGVWRAPEPIGDMAQRMVYTLVGPDEYTLESYGTMGEHEMLHMKIVFTRKKAEAATRCCPPRKKLPYTGTRRP